MYLSAILAVWARNGKGIGFIGGGKGTVVKSCVLEHCLSKIEIKMTLS